MTAVIDPAYTLGRDGRRARPPLQALAAEGLPDANARRPLPAVPLRVGLVTSDGSAACEDFLHELEASGPAGRSRSCTPGSRATWPPPPWPGPAGRRRQRCRRRGPRARRQARARPATFDNELVARAIAHLPVPVLTGIGHEIGRQRGRRGGPHPLQDADRPRRRSGRPRAPLVRPPRRSCGTASSAAAPPCSTATSTGSTPPPTPWPVRGRPPCAGPTRTSTAPPAGWRRCARSVRDAERHLDGLAARAAASTRPGTLAAAGPHRTADGRPCGPPPTWLPATGCHPGGRRRDPEHRGCLSPTPPLRPTTASATPRPGRVGGHPRRVRGRLARRRPAGHAGGAPPSSSPAVRDRIDGARLGRWSASSPPSTTILRPTDPRCVPDVTDADLTI